MADPRWRPIEDTNPVEPFPGVDRRTLVSGDMLTMIRLQLQPDAVVLEHSHPHEQAGTVASGRITVQIGSEKHEVVAGGSYLIPGDVPHIVTAHEQSLVFEVFAPVREEYADL